MPVRRNHLLLVVLMVLMVAASCTASQLPALEVPGTDVPGFLAGLWHGFIAPVTFIISLFTDTVRIYAYPNSGRLYDLGFMIGISGFSGGIFAGTRNKQPPPKREG